MNGIVNILAAMMTSHGELVMGTGTSSHATAAATYADDHEVEGVSPVAATALSRADDDGRASSLLHLWARVSG